MSVVPTLLSATETPKYVHVVEGGKMELIEVPGGKGKKVAVFHYLKVSHDKSKLHCKLC